jgi:hypothetical protein
LKLKERTFELVEQNICEELNSVLEKGTLKIKQSNSTPDQEFERHQSK